MKVYYFYFVLILAIVTGNALNLVKALFEALRVVLVLGLGYFTLFFLASSGSPG